MAVAAVMVPVVAEVVAATVLVVAEVAAAMALAAARAAGAMAPAAVKAVAAMARVPAVVVALCRPCRMKAAAFAKRIPVISKPGVAVVAAAETDAAHAAVAAAATVKVPVVVVAAGAMVPAADAVVAAMVRAAMVVVVMPSGTAGVMGGPASATAFVISATDAAQLTATEFAKDAMPARPVITDTVTVGVAVTAMVIATDAVRRAAAIMAAIAGAM